MRAVKQLADAYTGFDLDKPHDFSCMSIREVFHEVNETYPGCRDFKLITKLHGFIGVEGEDCELEITIVRKSQKRPYVQ